MLVLGYIWLPFVALPIFVSLESLDRRLLEAASDLGASRLQAFRRVTLPLSLPGVMAAFLFVFIPTLGEFVTPSLVGGASGYMYGNQIVDLFGTGFPDWETGSVLAIFLFGVVAVADGRLRAVPPAATGGGGLMDVALSQNGARLLRGFFALVVVFLYAPIVILLIFSFNNSEVPSFPLSGFTLHWYHQFLDELRPGRRCETSAIIAALSSVGAVVLGVLASVALDPASLPGKGGRLGAPSEPPRDPVRGLRDLLLLLFHASGCRVRS